MMDFHPSPSLGVQSCLHHTVQHCSGHRPQPSGHSLHKNCTVKLWELTFLS